ncbi:hypothetical protein GCM10010168_59500 [Actinoplanes ianthinogenes]|nr:hypothetical protein GCM10010168_59500 [Actinoplanes ianthinogenes]
MNEGPGAERAGAQGYGLKTPSTDRFVGFSFPHPATIGRRCEDRVSVTGDHLTSMGLRCPPAELELRPDGGRSNGVQPSLSSSFTNYVPSADVRAPRDFAAPHMCGGLFLHQAEP